MRRVTPRQISHLVSVFSLIGSSFFLIGAIIAYLEASRDLYSGRGPEEIPFVPQ